MKHIIFHPTLDEREKDGYYFMKASCNNCSNPRIGGTVDVMIPVGMKKPIKKFKCPNCGVMTMKIL